MSRDYKTRSSVIQELIQPDGLRITRDTARNDLAIYTRHRRIADGIIRTEADRSFVSYGDDHEKVIRTSHHRRDFSDFSGVRAGLADLQGKHLFYRKQRRTCRQEREPQVALPGGRPHL